MAYGCPAAGHRGRPDGRGESFRPVPAGCPDARAPATAGCQVGQPAGPAGRWPTPVVAWVAFRASGGRRREVPGEAQTPGHGTVSGMLLVRGVSAFGAVQVAGRP